MKKGGQEGRVVQPSHMIAMLVTHSLIKRLDHPALKMEEVEDTAAVQGNLTRRTNHLRPFSRLMSFSLRGPYGRGGC